MQDHELTNKIAAVTSATVGGIMWASANAFKVMFASNQPDAWAVKRMIAESILSVMFAIFAGWFVAPAVILWFHFQQIEIISVVSVCIGLVFWNIAPSIIALLSNFSLSGIAAFLTKSQTKS